jgi:hypothetical protein
MPAPINPDSLVRNSVPAALPRIFDQTASADCSAFEIANSPLKLPWRCVTYSFRFWLVLTECKRRFNSSFGRYLRIFELDPILPCTPENSAIYYSNLALTSFFSE